MVYGRRRCGKSTLLQRVLAEYHVYLQADQRESPLQLESLAAEGLLPEGVAPGG